ncbi:hypothetical protein ABVK25_012503 [Lepraria finkii]|uniref:Dyp-type peroxidase C-terminal domain-containing protein n=1 Tax=Lepraria finkii TaxID=1340010 RepID=A0ABR4AF42_9LECA
MRKHISASIWPETKNDAARQLSELHVSSRGQRRSRRARRGSAVFTSRSLNDRILCFEFERQLLTQLGDSVEVVDSTAGFRYFDVRDLLGFVDGTANPVGADIEDAVLITSNDAGEAGAAAVGGGYIVVQKYLHDLSAWNKLSTETQERIVGRTKFDNVELDDAGEEEQKPHKQLATIEKDGVEYDIVRDNMPFGNAGQGEFGTYFIGYSKSLWIVEEMLRRMFVGVPEGRHDRILDYSRAVTGVYFAPGFGCASGFGDGD